MVLFIVSVSIALGVSALCSLLEATLLSLTPSQIATISTRRPVIGAIWQRFKAQIERPIAVILICNTAAHTIGAAIAGAQFAELWGEQYLLAFSLLFTFLMLQFTEILPKTMGVKFNKDLAPIIARPLQWVTSALSPIVTLIHLINRPFEGRRSTTTHAQSTLAEISAVAGLARLSNLIGTQQERIIIQASRLSSIRVGQIMLAAEDVVMLHADGPLTEALVQAHLDLHTRFPVTEKPGDPQQIIGYVNFKELILLAKTHPHNPSLREITRPLISLIEDLPVSDALRRMVTEHLHLALVRNRQGLIVGMVTQEDLFEQLVGDIEDEFDRLPRNITPSGKQWIIGGGATLGRLRHALNRPDLGNGKSGDTTLNEWINPEEERKLRGGDLLQIDSVSVLVRKVRRGKITEAVLSTDPGTPATPTPA